MTEEHVHRWHLQTYQKPICAICLATGCGAEIGWDEIERRLNATSRLSSAARNAIVDNIQYLREHYPNWFSPEALTLWEGELRAYAAELEQT